MPDRPMKPCAKCKRKLTKETYCDKCADLKKKQYQNKRNKSWQYLYGNRWKKARLTFLIKHPLCAYCLRENKVVSATIVDHVIPHKGNIKLFWDISNWNSLCEMHHNKKTAKEGAFGNVIE